MTQRIAVIPGDGIGPEVARIGVRVLESLGLPLQFEWFDFGAERYLRDGTTLPPGSWRPCARTTRQCTSARWAIPACPAMGNPRGFLSECRSKPACTITL